MSMRENLYFIAIVVPDPVAAEITAFKQDIFLNYNSKAALRTMPHITLKAPFKLLSDKKEHLLEWFKGIPVNLHAFPVVLNNFGCFNTNHSKVIFVKPVMSDELLISQSEIIKSFSSSYPRINMSTHEHEFKAHITIAYRDLTDENFDKAWNEYKNKTYHAEFICTGFCLLQHNGMKWEIIAERCL